MGVDPNDGWVDDVYLKELFSNKPRWWLQPIFWYESNWISSPRFGVKIENIWNHQKNGGGKAVEGKHRFNGRLYLPEKNMEMSFASHWKFVGGGSLPKNNILIIVIIIIIIIIIIIWLVVSTPLKNISQTGNLPQVGVKIWNIWNHHLVIIMASHFYSKVALVTCPGLPAQFIGKSKRQTRRRTSINKIHNAPFGKWTWAPPPFFFKGKGCASLNSLQYGDRQ